MDGYAVKVDELGKLIGDLDTAAGKMTEANRKLGGGGAFGSLGTAELGQAGVEFEEAWGYGIGRLGEAASEVTERLKAAKQKYEQIEAQFGDQLGAFGAAVLGDGGDPTGGVKGDHPRIGSPAGGPVGGGSVGGGPLGGGSVGGGPLGGGSVGGGPLGGGPVGESPVGESPVGGGYTGGVPGIDGLASKTEPGEGPVGGGATGGITDLLNGLDR
ncbi:hypothetical protein [Amycolatopsis sp. NPDC004625]|uniref:hypothetical protein n=1 Tax=Amycolatopsis sp. NPDC004625 TaxID=3154670 RepID=UPI0033BB14C0